MKDGIIYVDVKLDDCDYDAHNCIIEGSYASYTSSDGGFTWRDVENMCPETNPAVVVPLTDLVRAVRDEPI